MKHPPSSISTLLITKIQYPKLTVVCFCYFYVFMIFWRCFGIFGWCGRLIVSLYFITSWLAILCHGGHANFVLLIMLDKTMFFCYASWLLLTFVLIFSCWNEFCRVCRDSDRFMMVGYPAGHIFPWQSTRVALWV
jgi:hypothetical protein